MMKRFFSFVLLVMMLFAAPVLVNGQDGRSFNNCTEAAYAGQWDIPWMDAGYEPWLDGDSDGIACEYFVSYPEREAEHCWWYRQCKDTAIDWQEYAEYLERYAEGVAWELQESDEFIIELWEWIDELLEPDPMCWQQHRVRWGDTLSRLSLRYFGDAKYYDRFGYEGNTYWLPVNHVLEWEVLCYEDE